MLSGRRGVFWPVSSWLVLSSFLFLGQYHRTHIDKAAIRFTVSLEREPVGSSYVRVNGRLYVPGESCGLGWKNLAIEVADAEPFQTNCFVRYSGQDLGLITLSRSRGQLELDISPVAESVRITGANATETLDNVAQRSVSLPTGQYAIKVSFAHFTTERTVEVMRNQTNRMALAPAVTAINLKSDPDGAEFELTSVGSPEVSLKGNTPTNITGLPSGKYELAMARGDYRKTRRVNLDGPDATNYFKVEFRYAKLSIASDPAEATISSGGKAIGTTPVIVYLQPGSYEFHITKEGHLGTNLNLTLYETDVRSVSVSLMDVSFAEAIERAQRYSSGAGYERALVEVDRALQIRPSDKTALELKRTIEFERHFGNASQLERKSDLVGALFEVNAALSLEPNHANALALKSELEKLKRAEEGRQAEIGKAAAAAKVEERRNRAQKTFRQITATFPYDDLFAAQTMQFSGTLDAAHSAVERALAQKPEWNISRNTRLSDEMSVIHAHTKGFGWKQDAVFLIGQTTDKDVVIYSKLIPFVVSDHPQGGSLYKPLHPKHTAPDNASSFQKLLSERIREFRDRIEKELR